MTTNSNSLKKKHIVLLEIFSLLGINLKGFSFFFSIIFIIYTDLYILYNEGKHFCKNQIVDYPARK